MYLIEKIKNGFKTRLNRIFAPIFNFIIIKVMKIQISDFEIIWFSF